MLLLDRKDRCCYHGDKRENDTVEISHRRLLQRQDRGGISTETAEEAFPWRQNKLVYAETDHCLIRCVLWRKRKGMSAMFFKVGLLLIKFKILLIKLLLLP